MRNVRDLKQIVNGSRQKSRMNGIAGAQEDLGETEPFGDYDQNKGPA